MILNVIIFVRWEVILRNSMMFFQMMKWSFIKFFWRGYVCHMMRGFIEFFWGKIILGNSMVLFQMIMIFVRGEIALGDSVVFSPFIIRKFWRL